MKAKVINTLDTILSVCAIFELSVAWVYNLMHGGKVFPFMNGVGNIFVLLLLLYMIFILTRKLLVKWLKKFSNN